MFILALVAAACSSEEVDRNESGNEENGPGSAESVPVTSPGTSETSETTRFRAAGLTLLYPTDLFNELSVDDRAADSAALTVTYETDAEPAAALLTVDVVRTLIGEVVSDLSDDDRDRLSDLEGLSGETDGLDFVNGKGIRTLTEDGYRYAGLTTDGRFLVRFTTGLTGEDIARQLDTMVNSVFVDGAADVYRIDDCEDDIEILTENGLQEGAVVRPGVEVTATWGIKNSGTCTWGEGYSWVFTGGEPVIVLSSNGVARTAPGEATEVEIVFVAPTELGRHSAQWQLQSPSLLEPLGSPAFVLFEVAV